eukprot:522076_1
MGKNTSDLSCNDCSMECNCFTNDKNVKNREIIRYSSSKWIWTQHHDNIFKQHLPNIPYAIILLIKDHAFSIQQDYYIVEPNICEEKYYIKLNQLLLKSLCSDWYAQNASIFNSFTITLFSKSNTINQQINGSFANTTLPALNNIYFSNNENDYIMQTIRRTVFVNQCRATINLQLLNVKWHTMKTEILKSKSIKNSNVNILLLDNCSNTISDFDEIIRKMNGSVYVIIRAVNTIQINNNICIKAVESQLCRNYNIPIIDVSLNSDQSVKDLFCFVIKHYWFSMVSNCCV